MKTEINIKLRVPSNTRMDRVSSAVREMSELLGGIVSYSGTGFRIDVPEQKGPDLWEESVARARLSVYEGR